MSCRKLPPLAEMKLCKLRKKWRVRKKWYLSVGLPVLTSLTYSMLRKRNFTLQAHSSYWKHGDG